MHRWSEQSLAGFGCIHYTDGDKWAILCLMVSIRSAFPLLFCGCLVTVHNPPTRAYQEAPMLAELVQSGKLPPVEERLPEKPPVVEPVREVGKYGGDWRKLAVVPWDLGLDSRMGCEPLARWDTTGRKVVPGLAESWEVSDGGRTYTFHLRKGIRWSDGHPLTSEDFMFAYEDVLLNPEITPAFPQWLVAGGEKVVMSAPDAFTIEFRFAVAYGIFLELLAYRGTELNIPKHYMKDFHPKYSEMADIEKRLADYGFDLWFQMFNSIKGANLNLNTELPTLHPWKLTVPFPASRAVADRNPYYYKVDTAGNQLPYIDRVVHTVVQNREIGNFKAMAGEVDFQARFMNSTNYTLFKGNEEKGDYVVRKDPDPVSTVIYLNQSSKDPTMRKLLTDRRFRVALSVAINREELIDLIYFGLATKSRGVVSPYDPYYLPEFDEKYLEYDPEKANQLLDEVGLPRGRDGMRRMQDGTRFKQILNCYPSEVGTGIEQWELVADYWREIGLDFVLKTDSTNLSVLKVRNGNSDFWAYATVGMHWTVDPMWYVPLVDRSYFAPLYRKIL